MKGEAGNKRESWGWGGGIDIRVLLINFFYLTCFDQYVKVTDTVCSRMTRDDIFFHQL